VALRNGALQVDCFISAPASLQEFLSLPTQKLHSPAFILELQYSATNVYEISPIFRTLIFMRIIE
jgi:hypothetical protein